MKNLSAVLITWNEERKITEALQSLAGLCEEIVIVDSFSHDSTVEICRKFTDRVLQREWGGYREQKQFATDQARYQWVLSLDADEAVSQELAREIRAWKQDDSDSCDGYLIPRKTWFLKRWIEHTTWYPDRQLRLFRKTAGKWQGGRVHEAFKISSPPGRFSGHIFHYTYESVSEYLVQLDRFSSLAAADSFDSGRRAGFFSMAFQPPMVFLKNYLLHSGFRDGIAGLAVSIMAGASSFFKLLKLWELQNGSKPPNPLR